MLLSSLIYFEGDGRSHLTSQREGKTTGKGVLIGKIKSHLCLGMVEAGQVTIPGMGAKTSLPGHDVDN
jgi:hypothetical protein